MLFQTEEWGVYKEGYRNDSLLLSLIREHAKIESPITWNGDVDVSLLMKDNTPILIVVNMDIKSKDVSLKIINSIKGLFENKQWLCELCSGSFVKLPGKNQDIKLTISGNSKMVLVPVESFISK
ncbi:MAG TPA: hypothetical protein DC049_06435 [Spirochaetia bacterium]|nr:hypothetical protein [Spirochaetia bacterium]